MNLHEAMRTHKYFKRPHWDLSKICWFNAQTGPYSELVSCDYFVIYEYGIETFSTSLDLYAEDILANDYILSE